MKHLLIILFLFLPFVTFSQSKTTPTRDKGEVFKHTPSTPYEDLSKSGVVVVTNGMYGLTYEDDQLTKETKAKVARFFAQRNTGYTELKKYTLRVENRQGVWYIEGYKVE